MAKRDQHNASLAEAALLGLLLEGTPRPLIPARPWPVAAACTVLSKVGQDLHPSLRHAAESGGALRGEPVIEGWLRALAAEGALIAHGHGMSAHWTPAEEWLSGWRIVAEGFDTEGQRAWKAATQTFTNALSIWQKTLAAASNGSTPSDSSA
jgi:hypothetical protein